MEFVGKQVAPPKAWTTFEDLCRALFSAVWGDPYTQKNGRAGQPQHGVDVWGHKDHGPFAGIHCVQCKGKDGGYNARVSRAEFDRELRKAACFAPTPSFWILATTAPNDEALQRHARTCSSERQSRGDFPVAVLGWETLVGLMAEHPHVIETFYPEHSSRLEQLVDAVQSIPNRDEWQAILSQIGARSQTTGAAQEEWQPISFEGDRGLGPALLGRALGPADAKLCPRLPEADVLVAELRLGHSARLTGVAGAGKSICALQAAETLSRDGFRVVVSTDPRRRPLALTQDGERTLHIVDDAHLALPQVLVAAEQTATSTKLLLSTHTAIDEHIALPGTVHLDSKRAVQVIADGLRNERTKTLEAVRQVDDRVGDGPGDESIERRLAQAEQAQFPWQFCFILSGGWRRVGSIVASARAVSADIALVAIALRQLASRDAPASEADIAPLCASAGLSAADAKRAITWLVGQRIVNSRTDLRCPHQRFASASFDPILAGQTAEGRARISTVIGQILDDPSLPLAGLTLLLTEWRMAGQFGRWTSLVPDKSLENFLTRCWNANQPEDIRAACFAFRELEVYRSDWMKRVTNAQVATLAGWFSHPLPGAGYAIGSLINGTYRYRPLGRRIIRASDPEAIAKHLNRAPSLFACEIAEMVNTSSGAISADWKARYFNLVDKPQCLNLVSNWPLDAPLSAAADYCNHIARFDEEFGFSVIEALADRIAERAREAPAETFGELSDVFWFCLRVYDPLQMYTGKKRPTARMLQVSAKLCAMWEPKALAAKLSESPLRQFQNAAGLLSVLHKTLPELFQETVAALDWDRIDQTIGDLWPKLPHDVEVFFGQCYASRDARRAMSKLVADHVQELEKVSPRIALIAPEAARQVVDKGGVIGIGGDWRFGAGVLADFATNAPELVPALLRPHEAAIANKLSQASPTFYDEALGFLRIYRQLAPESFSNMLAKVDCSTAESGWANALTGGGQTPKGRRSAARRVIAWLIHHSKHREDATGRLARDMAERFGHRSAPDPRSLEPTD